MYIFCSSHAHTYTHAKGNDCFSTNNIKLNAFIARHKFLLANIYCTVTFNFPEMFYYTRKKEVDHVIHSGLKFLSCVLCLPYICKKIYNSCKIFLSEKSCEEQWLQYYFYWYTIIRIPTYTFSWTTVALFSYIHYFWCKLFCKCNTKMDDLEYLNRWMEIYWVCIHISNYSKQWLLRYFVSLCFPIFGCFMI